MEYNHNSEELLKKLEQLKDTDIEAFTNLILAAFRLEPNHVLEDPHPAAHKLRALNSMIEYLETTERYEDCAFLKRIIDNIEDKDKDITLCGMCGGDASICDGC